MRNETEELIMTKGENDGRITFSNTLILKMRQKMKALLSIQQIKVQTL